MEDEMEKSTGVACDRCRSRKTRCSGPSASGPSSSCRACLKASEPCVYTVHRRGRKTGQRLAQPVKLGIRLRHTLEELQQIPTSERRKLLHGLPRDLVTVLYDGLGQVLTRNNEALANGEQRSLPDLGVKDAVPEAFTAMPDRFELPDDPSLFSMINLRDRAFSSLRSLLAGSSIGGGSNSFQGRAKRGETCPLLRVNLVSSGIFSDSEARRLHQVFMEKMNPVCYVLDPNLHDYDSVIAKSDFLHTVIVALAYRFSLDAVPSTVAMCGAYAGDQVLRSFVEGGSTIESVQALLLLIEYKNLDEDNGYMLLGLACRIGMDLELGVTRPELSIAENRNRIRTWINLYCSDRRYNDCDMTSKITVMPLDETIRTSEHFHLHEGSLPLDVRLCAGAQLRREWTLLKTETMGNSKTVAMSERYTSWRNVISNWYAKWSLECAQNGQPFDVPLIWVSGLHTLLLLGISWLADPSPTSVRDRSRALSVTLEIAVQMLQVSEDVDQDIITYAPDTLHLYFSAATLFISKAIEAGVLNVFQPTTILLLCETLQNAVQRFENSVLNPEHTISLHVRLLRHVISLHPMLSVGSSGRDNNGDLNTGTAPAIPVGAASGSCPPVRLFDNAGLGTEHGGGVGGGGGMSMPMVEFEEGLFSTESFNLDYLNNDLETWMSTNGFHWDQMSSYLLTSQP